MTYVVGHKAQREFLFSLVSTGKLPHALLFSGPSGVGKRIIAREICVEVLKNAQPDTATHEKTLMHFSHGSYPDYYEIDCLNREAAAVAEVRKLLNSLHLKSFSGLPRLVLFDNAEHLSLQAANVLLKSLEEPHPDTYFFLICSNPSRLPPTLRSRCQSIFFEPLKLEEVREVIETTENLSEFKEQWIKHSKFEQDELLSLADGSLHNVASITQHYETWEETSRVLKELAEGNSKSLDSFSREVSKDRDGLRERLRLMRIIARNEMLNSTNPELKGRWARLVSNVVSSERLIFERNLNLAAVVINILSDLIPNSRKSLNDPLIDEIVVQ